MHLGPERRKGMDHIHGMTRKERGRTMSVLHLMALAFFLFVGGFVVTVVVDGLIRDVQAIGSKQ
jgi:hypothetical protein